MVIGNGWRVCVCVYVRGGRRPHTLAAGVPGKAKRGGRWRSRAGLPAAIQLRKESRKSLSRTEPQSRESHIGPPHRPSQPDFSARPSVLALVLGRCTPPPPTPLQPHPSPHAPCPTPTHHRKGSHSAFARAQAQAQLPSSCPLPLSSHTLHTTHLGQGQVGRHVCGEELQCSQQVPLCGGGRGGCGAARVHGARPHPAQQLACSDGNRTTRAGRVGYTLGVEGVCV